MSTFSTIQSTTFQITSTNQDASLDRSVMQSTWSGEVNVGNGRQDSPGGGRTCEGRGRLRTKRVLRSSCDENTQNM